MRAEAETEAGAEVKDEDVGKYEVKAEEAPVRTTLS